MSGQNPKVRLIYKNPDGTETELKVFSEVNYEYSLTTGSDYTFLGGKTSRPAKEYARCLGCNAELSTTLDAYYGRDSRGKDHCSPCRTKRGIK